MKLRGRLFHLVRANNAYDIGRVSEMNQDYIRLSFRLEWRWLQLGVVFESEILL